MKKNLPLTFLFFLLFFNKTFCQEIIYNHPIGVTCADSLKNFNVTVDGQFGAGNQFSIEFSDEYGYVTYSQPINIINGKVSFKYPPLEFVKTYYMKIRSSNPERVFNFGYLTIYTKPRISLVFDQLEEIQSKTYEKNEVVTLPYKASPASEISYETISGQKFKVFGGNYFSMFSVREIVKSDGYYGIKKATNFCGTVSLQNYGYQLRVKPERFSLINTEALDFVCTENTLVISLQTENPLPDDGLSFDVVLTNQAGQAFYPEYSRNKSFLSINIPDNQPLGMYNLKVRIHERNIESTLPIRVKAAGSHTIWGAYNVKYGESFDITGYSSQIDDSNYYAEPFLYLDNKIRLEVSQYIPRKIKFNAPTQSGYYPITSGFMGGCKNKVSGGIQVNVSPSIRIESISNTSFCRGQDVFLTVSSNLSLSSSNSYKVRLGHSVNTEAFSGKITYSSSYDEINATWVSGNTLKFSVPLNVSFSTKSLLYVSVIANNPNIEGIIYPEPIRVLEKPNVSFTNTTYNIFPGTFLANYTSNAHEGKILMSDGRIYNLEENHESWNDDDGHIRPLSYQTGYYYPVSVSNKCGVGTVSGGYSVYNTDPNRSAVLLTTLQKTNYCTGDTLRLDWTTNGYFGSLNKFFVEFGSPADTLIEIQPGQTYIIIPNLGADNIGGVVRIKSTNPEAYSSFRNIHITQKPISPVLRVLDGTPQLFYYISDSVRVNSYNPVTFSGSTGVFRTSNNTTLPMNRPVYYQSDQIININNFSNSCQNTPFNKQLKIDYHPYLFTLINMGVSCNKYLNQIYIRYQLYGDIPQNMLVGVQFRATAAQPWSNMTVNVRSTDYLIASLDSRNVSTENCWVRFVRTDSQGNFVEVLGSPIAFNVKKYHDSYRLTSTLGNNIVSDTFPVNFQLNLSPPDRSVHADILNPNGWLFSDVSISDDQKFFASRAFNECGSTTVTDTVKVSITPQIREVLNYFIPCKDTDLLFEVNYTLLNQIPSGTTLKFYLQKNGQKYYIGQTTNINGNFTAAMPTYIGEGIYDLGYELSNANISRIFAMGVRYQRKGTVRIIAGNVYKYPNDPFYISFEATGGNSNYQVRTNVLYDNNPYLIWLNEEGYQWGYQPNNSNPDSVEIIYADTYNNVCPPSVSTEKLSVTYLPYTGRKIYAEIRLSNSQIPTYCSGSGGTLEVEVSSEGYFNYDNEFIPQISDKFGLNFIDVPYQKNGNLFTITMPSNLVVGEAYRIRFRSTSPAETGASSNSVIIIKPRPQVNLSGTLRINEGQTATITSPIIGTPPFNIVFNDSQVLNEYMSGILMRVVQPAEDFAYRITQLTDKYCNGTPTGEVNVVYDCTPLKQLSGNETNRKTYKAFEIRSSSTLSTSANVEYKGKKAILLTPGFVSEKGSVFKAGLNGCPN